MFKLEILQIQESGALITAIDPKILQIWSGQRPVDESKIDEIVREKSTHSTIPDFGELQAVLYGDIHDLRNINKLANINNSQNVQKLQPAPNAPALKIVPQNAEPNLQIRKRRKNRKAKEVSNPLPAQEESKDHTIYIIDGQHRFNAFLKIERPKPKLRLFVHFVKSDSETRRIFSILNKATPVPEIYSADNFSAVLREWVAQFCIANGIKIGSGGCKRPTIDVEKYSEQVYSENANLYKDQETFNMFLTRLNKYLLSQCKQASWIASHRRMFDLSDVMVSTLTGVNAWVLGFFYISGSRVRLNDSLRQVIQNGLDSGEL